MLLADDHQIVLAAFTRLLEAACEVVGTVTDGQAAVKAAAELQPDLVLLDVARHSSPLPGQGEGVSESWLACSRF